MEQQFAAANPYSWAGWFAPLDMNGLGQVSRLMHASCESAMQVWSATVQGSIEHHKKQLGFASMRLQKNIDMAASLSRCSDLQQALDCQADYGRDLIEDYLQRNQEVAQIAQSTLDLCREVLTPVTDAVEKVSEEASASGSSAERVSHLSKRSKS